MSLQIRFLVEVAPSDTEDAAIRIEQTETIMPATVNPDDWSDIVVLGEAALGRIGADVTGKATSQLQQFGEIQAKVASGE